MKGEWYILEGREPVRCMDLQRCMQHYAETGDRALAKTIINPSTLDVMDGFAEEPVSFLRTAGRSAISTIFLGMDHQMADGPPLLFETRVFGGMMNGYYERCATWSEAERQHANVVDMVRSDAKKRSLMER